MALYLEDIIRPGERVDIQELEADDYGEKKLYITKVYDIDKDEDIYLQMPMDKTRLHLLPTGGEYEAFFYAKKGIYRCEIRIEERLKDNNISILRIAALTNPEKHQRREYYRYGCIIGMACQMLDKAAGDLFRETRRLPDVEPSEKCVIVDISGGGLRFVTASKLTKGELLHCRYVLPMESGGEKYDHVIKILAEKPVLNNPKNTEYRGEFVNISSFDRERIIHYIFEEERKVRQHR
ncbi:MAG: flagellar brake domain-containing protein [Lachnospiraceae bacterium]|nr:flagellar brake domain-containing protein [Lachnospiraceae bacterium]